MPAVRYHQQNGPWLGEPQAAKAATGTLVEILPCSSSCKAAAPLNRMKSPLPLWADVRKLREHSSSLRQFVKRTATTQTDGCKLVTPETSRCFLGDTWILCRSQEQPGPCWLPAATPLSPHPVPSPALPEHLCPHPRCSQPGDSEKQNLPLKVTSTGDGHASMPGWLLMPCFPQPISIPCDQAGAGLMHPG